VKYMPKEQKPSSVTEGSKQEREIHARWQWVEPAVWTERMLETLEKGVKGGKWFSLVDKVYSDKNLNASWERVQRKRGSAGVDGQSVAMFERGAQKYLTEIQQALKEGTYHPQDVKRKWIPKSGSAGMRPLGIPTVKDRVVQTALLHVLEPIWENRFTEHSYGFRPGRCCKDALRRVDGFLKSGYNFVIDADIQSYFDSIDHDILMEEVEKEVSDGRVLNLLRAYLKQGVLEGVKEWKAISGTPQGAVISPLLANIYLHPVDVALKEAGFEAVRYADDLVILCISEDEAVRAMEILESEMSRRKLTLHPEKTRIVDVRLPGGFDFLGYHFERGYRWPRKKSLKSLKDRVRLKTKRANGQSLSRIIEDINPVLRGWFNYFKHSCKNIFPSLDGWVRMRLRSILRKRSGGKGKGRGADNQKWPNAFFAESGLFTMKTARESACQSRCGNH